MNPGPDAFDPRVLVGAAMDLATQAAARGDPPFGAVLADRSGRILVSAANAQVTSGDPTAHGEIELLRRAAEAGRPPPWRDLVVAVNAEPCSMCASALVKAEVGVIVFGAAHEPHMDPDLPLADVLARARRSPRVIDGVLADAAAAQIAAARAASNHPVD
ncbi:MAG: nucleoside deaminase [Chloroflexota bacterium]